MVMLRRFLVVLIAISVATTFGQSMPAGRSVPAKPRLVFAHYFPPYPVSLDNAPPASDYYATQYLNPFGENGKHAAYGGLLRDRPIPREPRSGNWRAADLRDEVATAARYGIDGFGIDILTPHTDPQWVSAVPQLLLDAAAAVSPTFKIMLQPDMSGEMAQLTPTQLAAEIAYLAGQPAAFRLDDGRLVVSPVMAERHDATWWKTFLDIMRETFHTPVALVPLFLNPLPYIDSFAAISYGMSEWGGRNPAFNPVIGAPSERVRKVQQLGKIWMQPISVQDERPNQAVYDEAENTQNLRNTWLIAIDSKADWALMVTWNDYSEGTAFAPSVKHGDSFLQICNYYAGLFKTGLAPQSIHDRVVLTHRTQLVATEPTYPTVSPMTLRAGSSPPRDTAEALTFLRAPAEVTVRAGDRTQTCSVPAGVGLCLVALPQPLTADIRVDAVVSRAGHPVLAFTSPYPVVARPYVQDLQYVAESQG
ncbi:glycoside hydrolase family 71 protein [Skermania sp. ID1734]|uniref:glycoside hydrolase family 71 protein n=1 Tax=Skermania sp. ID1734 TaxID=2597516 RepID=UPI0021077FB5|nr:glycoside hydrolase family 71 protein [Skermania sp. ID1734]